MVNPLEHIRLHPKVAKQLIGLTLPQLEQLIKQAIAKNKERKKAAEDHKIRVNKKGAGRAKNLSEEAEICLTFFYLRQMPIFEVLGIMFDVSRTTANDLFHYWLPILRDLLPCSLLEEWQNSIKNDEFVQELLTSYELLIDSAEQQRERPKNYQEPKKFFSGKKQKHTFKNQFVSLPKGRDIVDVIVGERGPEADVNLLRKQQDNFSESQNFKGDKAYIGANRTITPQKKPPKRELTLEQKESNKLISQSRIYVEHLIRLIKIFRVAAERFRLHSRSYKQVILVICGLVRFRIGALKF
ncbi:transposase [Hyella patelloides LEGE 07179]|uniref:Transposase n=1 Tax=Hyella patelloides LEGE 07179 TaxID=945734 RepID=A0A563VVG3_9CYAN|nr:transposase family protein [Hyella patelloides]VEP15458.1 transposase [Hyella patelloides LEGE 07179]